MSAKDFIDGVSSLGENAPITFRFLAKHGKVFTPVNTPLSGSYPLKECYKNAASCAGIVNTYCEGYATTKGLPIPLAHAWLSVDGVEAIDPTWADGDDYFGVGFSLDFIMDFQYRTRYHGVFENLYLLRMKPDAVFDYLETGLVYSKSSKN